MNFINYKKQMQTKRETNLYLTVMQVLLVLCLSFLLICHSIISCCFDLPFYEKNFHNLHTAEKVDISETDLINAINVLFDYLHGKRDDLMLKVKLTSTNQQVEMYNAREKEHMIDVRALFKLLLQIQAGLVVLVLILISLLFWPFIYNFKRCLRCNLTKSDNLGSHVIAFWASFRKATSCSLVLILCFITLISFFAWFDFEKFWWNFHELLFTNDLWQLDPASSRMINLVEGQFFNNLVTYILKYTASNLLLMYLFFFLFPTLCLRFIKRHHN